LIGAEFFWVRVQSNEKGVITGTVDNDLVNVKTIKCDDLISFPSHWVIDTLKEKKLQLGNFGA
jgi:hypothetical protein